MNREKIFEIQADLCRAMGNPLRMEIMELLRNEPLCVNAIAAAAHICQTTISRNLAVLHNAEHVKAPSWRKTDVKDA
jgi:predicted transcriptional regulator